MKKFGAINATRFAMAVVLFVSVFAATSLTTRNAEASAMRLYAIEKVLGLHERKNRKTIQKMVGINPATTPWCGAAAAYAVRKAGGTPPEGHNRAVSWKKFGKPVSLKSARKGDVVVLAFKRGHHVGIYKGQSKGRLEVCGGNMSNRFKCSNYRASSVRAIRR